MQQILDLLKNNPNTILSSSVTTGTPVVNPLIEPMRASPAPSNSSAIFSWTPMGFEDYNPKHRAKGTEPPEFADNKGVLQYPTWKLLLRDKLRIDRAQFSSEQDVMAYVFGHTKGDAQKHLFPRYSGETDQAVYSNHQEMITTLDTNFINKFHVRESKIAYQALKMDPSKSFQEFQTKFTQLANDGRIPLESRFDDLHDKMTVTLQTTLLPHLDILDGDFDKLCEKAIGVDAGIKRINSRWQAERFGPSPSRLIAANLGKPFGTSGSGSGSGPSSTDRSLTLKPTTGGFSLLQRPNPTATKPTSTFKCFNCGDPTHGSNACPQPKRVTDVKDIEEELIAEMKEDSIESGKE